MNESTLTPLKIIVERAVRPLRASISRKRKMREELLAHVVGVFEEEAARLGDEQAAVEQTAVRFGDSAEVTSRLQESVPAGDRVGRFFEGRPGEAALWVPIRLACWASAWAGVAVCAVLFLADWVTLLPREAMIIFGAVFLALPVYFFSVAFLTDCIEKGVYDPAGVSRLRLALSAAGSLLFMLLFVAGAVWSLCPTGWDPQGLGAALRFAGLLAACGAVLAWNLAHWNAPRRRYHEEWGRLPIELPS
jgi:ATP-dependent Clp protease ATP-binding subunit ClpC